MTQLFKNLERQGTGELDIFQIIATHPMLILQIILLITIAFLVLQNIFPQVNIRIESKIVFSQSV